MPPTDPPQRFDASSQQMARPANTGLSLRPLEMRAERPVPDLLASPARSVRSRDLGFAQRCDP
jgi:hypothetical protein